MYLTYSQGLQRSIQVEITEASVEEIKEIVREQLSSRKITAEEELQLIKICEKEDAFVKEFSKDKWREYFDLDIEKGQLTNLQIDQAIVITYEICKKIFQK